MSTQIRVVLADDHPLVRTGIRATLAKEPQIQVVGEARNGDEALSLCQSLQPDVLLLDLSMPGRAPLEVIRLIREESKDIKIVVLTAYNNDAYIRGMVRAGAAGYLLKEDASESVIEAVHTVIRGGSWFSQDVLGSLINYAPEPTEGGGTHNLTPREQQVLQLIARGMDNSRISQELHLAEQTVRNYTSRIYSKIGVNSRAEAIVWSQLHQLPGT